MTKEKVIELTISDYEWEGKIEYVYEIRGAKPVVYFSEVGFSSYDEAYKEGRLKLKELNE